MIDDATAVSLAASLSAIHPSLRGPLFPGGVTRLRGDFFHALAELRVPADRFSLYSLRKGGATTDFQLHGSIDRLLLRGRWSSTKSVRVYVREALHNVAAARLPEAARRLVHSAAKCLPILCHVLAPAP